ncbi:hypothetical protein [Aquincola tertiaricarbonis]|uniref:hypothetical protein n=1 Tax=Aquincola tertiaricarbonis TaxID=391953 RepID=UPI000614DC5D|nr:hypothetical protein [Aquincola tertiaricarbonis]
MPSYRETDRMPLEGDRRAGITIDRKIPLWGILTLVGAILAQGGIVWSGQREQAVEVRHQSDQISKLALQVERLGAQLATKDSKDIEQDLRLNELSRRVLTLETVPQASRPR